MPRTVMTVAPASQPQAIVVQVTSSVVTLRVVGDVDVHSWPSLEGALLACVDVEPECIVIDLTDVPFVSATACRRLDTTLRAMRGTGRQVAIEPARSLRRVAELTASAAVLAAVADPTATR